MDGVQAVPALWIVYGTGLYGEPSEGHCVSDAILETTSITATLESVVRATVRRLDQCMNHAPCDSGLSASSAPIQCLDQSYEKILHLAVDIHELHTHSWKQKVPLRFVSNPGYLRFGSQFLQGPIRQREFERQFRSHRHRRTTLDKQPASSDACGETLEFLPIRRRTLHLDGKRGTRVCAAMGECGIVAGNHSFDDLAPRHIAQQLPRWILHSDCFEIGIDDDGLALMARSRDDWKFHGCDSTSRTREQDRILGRLDFNLRRFHQLENPVANILRDFCELHSHPGTKRILIGFGTHPCHDPFGRKPFVRLFRK